MSTPFFLWRWCVLQVNNNSFKFFLTWLISPPFRIDRSEIMSAFAVPLCRTALLTSDFNKIEFFAERDPAAVEEKQKSQIRGRRVSKSAKPDILCSATRGCRWWCWYHRSVSLSPSAVSVFRYGNQRSLLKAGDSRNHNIDRCRCCPEQTLSSLCCSRYCLRKDLRLYRTQMHSLLQQRIGVAHLDHFVGQQPGLPKDRFFFGLQVFK